MSTRLRWVVWLGALAGIGFLALGDGEEEDMVEVVVIADSVERSPNTTGPKAQHSLLQWQRLASRTMQPQPRADLFVANNSSLAMETAERKALTERVAALETKRAAPAAPFRYLGQLDVGEEDSLVMLSDGIRVFTVHPGHNINAEWRLDQAQAQALHLTYLPLDISQIMPKSANASAPHEEHEGAL